MDARLLSRFSHPAPDEHARTARCPISRRAMLVGMGGALLLGGTPSVATATAPSVSGRYTNEGRSMLRDAYWQSLPTRSVTMEFEQEAAKVVQRVGGGRPLLDAFLRVCGEALTLLGGALEAAFPFVFNIVRVGASVISDGLGYLAPMVTNRSAFQVVDSAYKATSWLSYYLSNGSEAGMKKTEPWLIPTDGAAADRYAWLDQSVEGLSHPTRKGRVFISRDPQVDPYTGYVGRLVALQARSYEPVPYLVANA